MSAKLRLYSGFVLLVYVTGHLVTHALGIVSLETMNAGLRITDPPWRSAPGTVVLLGALVIHVGLALWSLYRRRTLRMMKQWEVVQLTLGLVIPLLLMVHVMGTRVLGEVYGVSGDYFTTMIALWVFKPVYAVQQAALLIVVWTHGMIGLHMWLRLKPWYPGARDWLLVIAILIPSLSLAGYVSAGMEILELAKIDGWVDAVLSSYGRIPSMGAFVGDMERAGQLVAVAVVALVFIARALRSAVAARGRKTATIRYAPGDRLVPLQHGATVLECLRAAGVPHLSVCGGRGRCSTCRVRVENGGEYLVAPDADEQRVLDRIGLSGPVRLACQIRPKGDIRVAALLPPEDPSGAMQTVRSHRGGDEVTVAILFVDLRGSTKLSEDRLPFDVVFILNQFFAELSGALAETDGHYAQFNGDGLMALYGLDTDIGTACRQAVAGATAMLRRMDALNDRLADELSEPLRIGIGIHAGEAIVGSMGPPATPIVSALGDNVNIAARLESQTKEFGVPLVMSARVAEYGDMDASSLTMREVPVKGRERPVRVYSVVEPGNLLN